MAVSAGNVGLLLWVFLWSLSGFCSVFASLFYADSLLSTPPCSTRSALPLWSACADNVFACLYMSLRRRKLCLCPAWPLSVGFYLIPVLTFPWPFRLSSRPEAQLPQLLLSCLRLLSQFFTYPPGRLHKLRREHRSWGHCFTFDLALPGPLHPSLALYLGSFAHIYVAMFFPTSSLS